jgi:hypothetical protein
VSCRIKKKRRNGLMRPHALSTLMLVSFVTPSLAQMQEQSMEKFAISGKTSNFYEYVAAEPCNASNWTEVRIITSPLNGDAVISEPAGGLQVRTCGGQASRKAVAYTPRDGYTGGDAFTIEVIRSQGTRTVLKFNIVVR